MLCKTFPFTLMWCAYMSTINQRKAHTQKKQGGGRKTAELFCFNHRQHIRIWFITIPNTAQRKIFVWVKKQQKSATDPLSVWIRLSATTEKGQNQCCVKLVCQHWIRKELGFLLYVSVNTRWCSVLTVSVWVRNNNSCMSAVFKLFVKT